MALIRCAACLSPLPDHLFQGLEAKCQVCGKVIQGQLFPALHRPLIASAPPSLPAAPKEGEATCFYSPHRAATKTCEHCGVFISDAWAAKWGNMTVCLKCVETLRTKGKDNRFETSRFLWDNIALSLVVMPWVLAFLFLLTIFGYIFSIFLIGITLVTAPAAIFVALRFWTAPRSLVPRGHFRLVTSLVLGLAHIVGWAVLIVTLVDYFSRRAS